MKKLQEKIKNIKTFFYSIVGGQFKKAVQKLRNLLTLKSEYQSSNNPQLTKLMETKMSFKELVKEKNELIEKRLNLLAKQSAIRYSKILYDKDVDYDEIDKLSDLVYKIDDKLQGINTKMREKGFEYELLIEKALPKSTGGEEIWVYTKTIITEKEYTTPINDNDLIELILLSNLNENENLKKFRRTNKY